MIAAATPSAKLPPPEQIREMAHTILSRPEYRLNEQPADHSGLMDRIVNVIRDILSPVSKGFDALMASSPVLGYLVVIVLVVLLVALIYHILNTMMNTLRGPKRIGRLAEEIEIVVDPDDWETRAKEAAGRGDVIGAIRFLFRAGVLRIEIAREKNFRRGVTNHEILRAVADSALADPVSTLVRTIDYKWYGGGDCSDEDFDQCSEAYDSIRDQTGGPQHVPRA